MATQAHDHRRNPTARRMPMALGIALGLQATAALAGPPAFSSDDEELLYFWGTTMGQQVRDAGIGDAASLQWITRGLQDAAANEAPAFGDEYPSLLNNHLVLRRKQAAAAEAVEAGKYVERMAAEKGARRTDSGLVYKELAAGKGKRPTADSVVKVHYTGTLRDGQVFDSSVGRGAPLETRLNAVIPCWTEAVQLMKPGGKARVTCPPAIAYGERGNRGIPGNAALTFEVELLEVRE